MKKLIKLLNEHEELSPSRIQRKYYQENWQVLMLLAIQDEPLKFLISYLK